jgi:uncharacterized protein
MSPPPESSSASLSPCSQLAEFLPEERKLLLAVAHEAIKSSLEHREISLESPTPHLAEPRGAFTTLYCRGELRGCVGYVAPAVPLYRTVAETARGAAFEDSRFWPVTHDEVPEVQISLSILSPLRPIHPNEIEVGRHGLLVTLGTHRGLLLPQVPVEHSWDRARFLDETCRKAGLPPGAWLGEANVEAFTAEVFGDSDFLALTAQQ